MDAFALQLLCGTDPLPGRGNLDEHPIAADAGVVIETDQLTSLGHRGLGIEAQTSVHFSGHPSGHDLENLLTEGDADLIQCFSHNGFGRGGGSQQSPRFLQGAINQLLVGGDLGRRKNQRGVGGRVTGSELLDGIDIAGVGDHHGHGGKLVEQVGHAGSPHSGPSESTLASTAQVPRGGVPTLWEQKPGRPLPLQAQPSSNSSGLGLWLACGT